MPEVSTTPNGVELWRSRRRAAQVGVSGWQARAAPGRPNRVSGEAGVRRSLGLQSADASAGLRRFCP